MHENDRVQKHARTQARSSWVFSASGQSFARIEEFGGSLAKHMLVQGYVQECVLVLSVLY